MAVPSVFSLVSRFSSLGESWLVKLGEMELDELAKRLLIKNMKKPLARAHLLLREHGWEPNLERSRWTWKKRGLKERISTWDRDYPEARIQYAARARSDPGRRPHR